MSETCIVIKLLWMYFPRNWEFSSALGVELTKPPPPRHATELSVELFISIFTHYGSFNPETCFLLNMSFEKVADTRDFYLWGAEKSAVYRDRPHTLNELKTSVTVFIRNISQADLQKALGNKIKRVQACIDAR
jgi:hypothetical protein